MTNNNHNQNKLIHHHQHHHNNHQLLPSQTPTRSNTTARSNSTTQACAACRYQRRKCAPDCILAPYFPHDRQRQFQNAHKLFGVSNITKLIRDLEPSQKDEAMRTIIYQSDVRAQDPVEGCYRIIRELHRQIEYSRAELEIVLHQLAICRAHSLHNQNQNQTQTEMHNQNDQILIDDDIHLVTNPDDPQLYQDLDNENNVNHVDNHALDLDLGQITQPQEHQHQHQEEDRNLQIHDILGQQNLNDQDHDNNDHVAWATMNNSTQQVDECDEFKHEFKFEFDEINEASEETLFNEGNHHHKVLNKEENVSFFTKEENVSYQQHNEDHDLKGAATLFTLTNCSSY